jgi:hypothetical protein
MRKALLGMAVLVVLAGCAQQDPQGVTQPAPSAKKVSKSVRFDGVELSWVDIAGKTCIYTKTGNNQGADIGTLACSPDFNKELSLHPKVLTKWNRFRDVEMRQIEVAGVKCFETSSFNNDGSDTKALDCG